MKHEPQFTPLDTATWNRRETFWYFSQMAPTGYSLTVDLDVTHLRAVLKTAGIKFFPAYLWLVTRSLNEQAEFKLAEREGKLGYYDTLTPLYAAFHEDDKTFSLLWTEYDDNFRAFYRAYLDNAKRYGDNHGILAQKDAVPPENAYTVSCIPWVSFRSFSVHSYENKPYYFPSVEAGKIYASGESLLLPLSITCHHAAADGYHVKRFLEVLQDGMDHMEQYV